MLMLQPGRPATTSRCSVLSMTRLPLRSVWLRMLLSALSRSLAGSPGSRCAVSVRVERRIELHGNHHPERSTAGGLGDAGNADQPAVRKDPGDGRQHRRRSNGAGPAARAERAAGRIHRRRRRGGDQPQPVLRLASQPLDDQQPADQREHGGQCQQQPARPRGGGPARPRPERLPHAHALDHAAVGPSVSPARCGISGLPATFGARGHKLAHCLTDDPAPVHVQHDRATRRP